MRRYLRNAFVLGAAALAASSSCAPREGTLSGDVFIVTKAGENVKLGLVEVAVLPYEATRASIGETARSAERETAKLQPALAAAEADVAAKTANQHKAEAAMNAASERSSATVSLASLDSFTAAIKRNGDALEQLHSAESGLSKTTAQIRHLKSGEAYFAHLPKPITSAKTDADGKFSVTIDRTTPVVLAAHATRLVGDSAENCYWLVRVSLDGQPTKRIFLSNDNLTIVPSADSVVHTTE